MANERDEALGKHGRPLVVETHYVNGELDFQILRGELPTFLSVLPDGTFTLGQETGQKKSIIFPPGTSIELTVRLDGEFPIYNGTIGEIFRINPGTPLVNESKLTIKRREASQGFLDGLFTALANEKYARFSGVHTQSQWPRPRRG